MEGRENMSTTTIRVSCLDQRLMLTSTPVIASGGRNENEVIFSFCPLWNDFEKIAVFYRDKDRVYSALLENDVCTVPWEVLVNAGDFFFSVFGTKDGITRTSEIVKYRIVEGAITEATEQSDPTPDIYEQLLEAYSDAMLRLSVHVHGNLTRDGKVGTEQGRFLTTGAGGAVQSSTPKAARDLLGYAAVATSGSYKDLKDKPEIPTVVDTVSEDDENAISGAAVIAYAQPKVTISTVDLVDGVSELADGEVYLVYE